MPNLFNISIVFIVTSLIAAGDAQKTSCTGQRSPPPQDTSVPLSTPEECARPCVAGAPPKNCYFTFTVELYRTVGRACNFCQPPGNGSLAETGCECILADGVDVSGIMIINRRYPGPPIQVCLGDLVIIDVHNRAVGTALTIHWHGLYQKDWQYFDGVPYVTQCPIPYQTSFRYRWRAQNSGTHWYHAHTGLHEPDGIQGAIVIRLPDSINPNRALYDDDDFEHIIFMNDWFHESSIDHWPGSSIRNIGQIPQSLLINGRGKWLNSTTNTFTNVSRTVYTVAPNRRVRFRLINSLAWLCPVRLTIQNHNLTIIATDGEDVQPMTVNTITSFPAERYDFVITTDKAIGSYWMQFRALGTCAPEQLMQFAVLQYTGSKVTETQMSPLQYNPGLPLGVIMNDFNQLCNATNTNARCVEDLQSVEEFPSEITAAKADITVLVPYYFYLYPDQQLYTQYSYENFQVPLGGQGNVALFNNISYMFASSPLLTQASDLPPGTVCNSQTLPNRCKKGTPCFCTHVVDVPLNAVVEIIMTDAAPIGLSHPFHLHGYGFHVLAQGSLANVPITEQNKQNAYQMHQQVYGKSNRLPPIKDTLASVSNGYTIVRFIADNPGYWLYHCHFQSHLLVGMALTFHVGTQADLPPVPKDFPKCGNFQPRI